MSKFIIGRVYKHKEYGSIVKVLDILEDGWKSMFNEEDTIDLLMVSWKDKGMFLGNKSKRFPVNCRFAESLVEIPYYSSPLWKVLND